MKDLPNLDFVRSVAVVSVVVEHILLATKVGVQGPFDVTNLGVLGVLVFFVLTSLVLMWSLERKPHTLDFYIRRWFRIYPLVIVMLLVCVLLHAPTGGYPKAYFYYAHPGLKDFIVQGALLQDIIDAPHSILSVLWSLPYEVQMYLLLPALFFFVRKNIVIWPLLLFWCFDVAASRHVPSTTQNFAVAIGYFLPGVMAYVGFRRWQPRFSAALLPVFLVALWVVFLYRFNFHKAWLFCLLVGLGLPLFRQIRAQWVMGPSQVIAKYSFGIYLTHPLALAIGLYWLRNAAWPLRLAGVLLPLVVLPVAAYHWVELPMMQYGSRVAARVQRYSEQRMQIEG